MDFTRSSIKEKIQTGRIRWKRNNYYRQSRGTSLFGQAVNLLLVEFVLFAAGYLWFVQRTKIPMLSLFLSLSVNALLTIAYVLRHRTIFLKEKEAARRKAAGKFLTEDMKRLSQSEFRWHIMRLLLRLDGISRLKSRTDYLETTFHGKRTAVGTYHAAFGEEIPPQPLASFLTQVKAEGFTEAIFLASGTYSEPCKVLAEKKKTMVTHLLDLDDILDIMEKSGMFPPERVIDTLIDEEILRRKQTRHIPRKELLTPKRFRAYLGYSLLFIALSRVFSSLSVYYTVVSVVFLVSALISRFRGRKTAEPADHQSFLDALTCKENG